MKHHVEYVCTHPLPQDDTSIAAFRRLQKELLTHAASDLQDFKNAQDLQKWFTHRCSICNRYCENTKVLMKHHLNEHPHEYQVHHAFYKRLVQIALQFQMFMDPCALCCAKVKKYHCCMIIRQTAMLQGHESLSADDHSKHVYSTSDDFPIYKCDICGETYRTSQGLDAHMITHEAADGFLFDAARDARPDQTCLHCNERFSSYQAVMRHIQNGPCEEFDEDKPIVTLLDFHPSLRSLIEDGKIGLILQNQDMVTLFDKQCTICQKPLDRRHSLQNHLTTVHGKHWKNAQALANALFNTFQTREKWCYCDPPVKTMKAHQCMIFRQIAILRTLCFPNASNEHLLEAPAPPIIFRFATKKDEMPTNQVTQESDQYALQDEPDSQDIPDEVLADRLASMLTDHTLIPPEQDLSNILSKAIAGNIEWHPMLNGFIHVVLEQRSPQLMYAILGGDVLAMLQTPSVSFLSDRCVLCNEAIQDPEDMWPHLCDHIIKSCPNLSLYSPGMILHQFMDHCKSFSGFYSNIHVNAALKQCLIIRVLAVLSHHGRDGYGDQRQADGIAQYLVPCHSRKRVAATTSQASKASKSQCRQKQGTEQNELRQLALRDAFASNGSLASQTRISVENSHDGTRVHHSPVDGQRLDPGRPTGCIKDVACRSESYQTTEARVGATHVADLVTKTGSIDGSQKGQSNDFGSNQGSAPTTRSNVAIPQMECQYSKLGALQGEEPDDGGSSCQVGTDPNIPGGSRHSAEVSFTEKATNGVEATAGSSAINCDSVGDDPLESDSPEYMAGPATIKLQLHLASHSMQLETSRTETQSIVGSDCQGSQDFIMRILQNPRGITCYINAALQGAMWCILMTGRFGAAQWKDEGRIFHTVTKWSPFPIDVEKHVSFVRLLEVWASHRSMMTHQDLMDFLQFLLEYLKPTCWNSSFLPRWLIGVEDRNAAQEKHTRWSAVRISLHNFTNVALLQELITLWHDQTGHQWIMDRNDDTQALAILIDRLDRSDKLDHINKTHVVFNFLTTFKWNCLI